MASTVMDAEILSVVRTTPGAYGSRCRVTWTKDGQVFKANTYGGSQATMQATGILMGRLTGDRWNMVRNNQGSIIRILPVPPIVHKED